MSTNRNEVIFSLSGSRAMVVGGTRVLDRRFAEVRATAGAQVCVAGRSAERGGIDVLVNAPGVNSSTPIAELTDDEWEQLLTQYLARELAPQGVRVNALVRVDGAFSAMTI